MHVDTFMFVLVDLIKIVQTVFWNGYLIITLYIECFKFMLHSYKESLQELIPKTKLV